MEGKIHSLESFGTVDGPGIRFVVFTKGCPLRCLYCHNPDTWYQDGARIMSCDELIKEILKYKDFFGSKGGVTFSGGEPLIQMDFIIECCKELKKRNIHTCIDTSGYTFKKEDKKFDELIKYVDLFLLDIKHINDDEHKKLTAVSNKPVLEFAKYLSENNKPMWIRHVLVPGYTLNDLYLKELKDFIDTLKTVEKVEVLPYHTMGSVKYENLGYEYKLKDVQPPTKEEVKYAKAILGA